MKIAVVHSYYSSDLPSGENTVVDMQVSALRKARHEVRVIEARTDSLRGSKGYAVRSAINVATGRGIDPTSRLQDFNPDIVHIHNLFPNFSTDWLKKWSGPVVSTVHNFRPVCASGILYREGKTCTLCPDSTQLSGVAHGCYRGSAIATIPLAIRNRRGLNNDPIIRRSDSLILLSERSRLQYESFGLSNSKISVLPNFVDASVSPLKASTSTKDWIYVGRIAPEKGVIRLVKSWPKSAKLHLYGDGPDAAALRALTTNNIIFHGLAGRSEVLSLMQRAEGLVIPSTCAENFPTVYVEALAAGIPVLAKSGNAAADDVQAAGTGRVFQEWNEVPYLLEQISLNRDGISEIAADRYQTHFTSRNWIKNIEALYIGLLDRK